MMSFNIDMCITRDIDQHFTGCINSCTLADSLSLLFYRLCISCTLADCLSVFFHVLCRPSLLVVVVVFLPIGHHHVDNFVLRLSFLLGIFEMFLCLGFLHECVGVSVHVSLTDFRIGSVSPYLTDPCRSY